MTFKNRKSNRKRKSRSYAVDHTTAVTNQCRWFHLRRILSYSYIRSYPPRCCNWRRRYILRCL